MSELHQKAEEFVLCAIADETCGNCEQNADLGLFLLSLIHGHKKGQLGAAHVEELNIKTKQVVALGDHAYQEIKP
ncbi:conserved hypothetical protein [Vibrio crassostreae]|nr:conserved hypothetical protein [Vibrio crassostreae]CAK2779169.1 conserved hypothetical protein [Vibrio crassostreae]CAK3387217.1 conserved hypothetical protein [Vibrio crassostreae]